MTDTRAATEAATFAQRGRRRRFGASACRMLAQMRADGRVVVTTEKRKNFYTLA